MRKKWISLLLGACTLVGCLLLQACHQEKALTRPTAGPGWDEDQSDVVPLNGGFERRDILLSVFWPPSKGFTTAEQFDYLVEAGIDLLEWGDDPIFTHKQTLEDMLRLCGERGLQVTVADGDFYNLLGLSDEELQAFVDRYKEMDCVAGYYLKDEPSNANPYGRVARFLSKADPDCITALNLLPAWALADPEGHAVDWVNAAGPENLRYLSYDQYPFGWQEGSRPSSLYANLDLIRRVGLAYGVDTALYIQSVGVVNNFRQTTVEECRFHTSAALAYGYKNLKYFTWMTPVNRGENFTDAIIKPDGTKSERFDGIAENNRNIKKVGSILGNLDAVEIYHNGTEDPDTTKLPSHWYLQANDSSDFLVSLMVDRFDGRNYLMIVNKNFQKDVSLSFRLTGADSLEDVTEGADKATSVRLQDGVFSGDFLAGGFRLYRLPEGVNWKLPYLDASDSNLALEKPVYSSSSLGQSGSYTTKANDGVRFSTDASMGWQFSEEEGQDGWLLIDLLRPVLLNRLDLYAMGKGVEYGFLFPSNFQVWASCDNKEYHLLLEQKDYVLLDEAPASFRFDTTKARFIKITVSGGVKLGGRHVAALSEVELYYDDGSVPAMALPNRSENLPAAGDNVALGCTTLVSSTLERPDWGWSQKFLNDGVTEQTTTHAGWTSQTGIHMHRDAQESVLFYLGEPVSIDRVVVHPCNSSIYFPQNFVVEVSLDGCSWTEVGSYQGKGVPAKTPQTISFEAVTARYVQVTATKLRGTPNGDGYLFQTAEIEIFRGK